MNKEEEKDKEIERLNKELEEYKKDYDRIYTENCKLREKHNITDIDLLDENYRLNNIINEMEKFIIYNLDYWNKESSQRSSLIKETLTNTLDTLRKLKGKNND